MPKTMNQTSEASETKMDVADLRSELAVAKAVSENSPINIILADTDLNITYANPASVAQLRPLEHLLPCRVDEVLYTQRTHPPLSHACTCRKTAFRRTGPLWYTTGPRRRVPAH